MEDFVETTAYTSMWERNARTASPLRTRFMHFACIAGKYIHVRKAVNHNFQLREY
jgi:hypothetical protein